MCAKAEDEIQFIEDEVFLLQPEIYFRYLAFQEGVECDECGSAISRGWVQEETAIICCAACTGTSLKRLRAIWTREFELVWCFFNEADILSCMQACFCCGGGRFVSLVFVVLAVVELSTCMRDNMWRLMHRKGNICVATA